MNPDQGKTEAALAAALKNLRDMLDGKPGAAAEAEAFLKGVEDGSLPAPRRFGVVVAQSDHEMPGFGAYVEGCMTDDSMAVDTKEGRIPTGLVLLNLDATFWMCLAQPDMDWKEVAAESVGHEFLHIIQELLGRNLSEWHVSESIEKARAAEAQVETPDPDEAPEWAERLDMFMTDAGAGAVVAFVDREEPEQSFVLEKVVPEFPGSTTGFVLADWRPVPSLIGMTVEVYTNAAENPDHTYTVHLPVPKDEEGRKE